MGPRLLLLRKAPTKVVRPRSDPNPKFSLFNPQKFNGKCYNTDEWLKHPWGLVYWEFSLLTDVGRVRYHWLSGSRCQQQSLVRHLPWEVLDVYLRLSSLRTYCFYSCSNFHSIISTACLFVMLQIAMLKQLAKKYFVFESPVQVVDGICTWYREQSFSYNHSRCLFQPFQTGSRCKCHLEISLSEWYIYHTSGKFAHFQRLMYF